MTEKETAIYNLETAMHCKRMPIQQIDVRCAWEEVRQDAPVLFHPSFFTSRPTRPSSFPSLPPPSSSFFPLSGLYYAALCMYVCVGVDIAMYVWGVNRDETVLFHPSLFTFCPTHPPSCPSLPPPSSSFFLSLVSSLTLVILCMCVWCLPHEWCLNEA